MSEKNNYNEFLIKSFVDEFGDETNEKFLGTSVEGTFKNTATTGDKLLVKILFSKKELVRFDFFDYGDKPSNLGLLDSDKDKWFMLAKKNGEKHNISGSVNGSSWAPHKDRNYKFGLTYADKVLELFKTGSTTKFLLTKSDSTDTIYNFSINVNGNDFSTKLSSLGITTKETQPSRPFWLNFLLKITLLDLLIKICKVPIVLLKKVQTKKE